MKMIVSQSFCATIILEVNVLWIMVGVVSACNVGLHVQLKVKNNDKTPSPFLL